jgi:hypothetical protein
MAVEGKEWLYYLLDSMGKTAQKENGLIVFKSNYKPLAYTPDGWQDINIGWERNLTKFGINRNFSLPLGFVLDGKDILDYIGLNKNFDERLFLLIQKQTLQIDPANYYFFYDKFYRGELDLTTIQSEENKTTINIMEGGLSKQLKANEATNYEIPVNDPEAITIKMDGINIRYEFRYIHVADIDGDPTSYDVNTGITTTRKWFMNFSRADATGQIIGIATFDVFKEDATSADFTTDERFFLQATSNVSLSATFRFAGHLKKSSGTGTGVYKIIVYDQTGTIVHTFLDQSTTDNIFNQPFNIEETVNLNLMAGDKLFLISYVQGVGSTNYNVSIDADESLSDFNFFSRFIDSTIRAIKPFTLYKRLIGNITGDESNALSTLLEAHPNLVVTSGDAIRSLPGNVVVKTNLNDFFTSYNVALNAGIGIENNKVVFESKEHFFDESDPIALGKVRNFKWKYATELLVNSVKIGWPNQTYDDVNGKQEFNTTQERSSVVQRVSKLLDLVSVYRADPFGIELTRINLEGKITTDSSSDNDVFIINIDLSSQNDDGSYNLKRVVPYDSVDGLLSPDTAFNIEELTPARLLEKHRNWINSVFYGFEGTKLTYQTSDKNRELKTVKGTVIYDEDADFTISDTPRLLKPILFEFEPESYEGLVELMEENPNRCFSFEHPNGNTYTGYNLKIGIAPNTLEEQAFQLISTASNDLKTLING